ncbi:MAG: hypothetical protein V1701_07420, partial [Planctomycetota bacterium]
MNSQDPYSGAPIGLPPTDCQAIRDRIQESIFEKTELHPEVLAHIKNCSECDVYCKEEMSFARQIAGEFESVRVPAPPIARILRTVENKNARRSTRPWFVPVAAAAIILIIVGFVSLLKLNKSPESVKTPEVVQKPVEPTESPKLPEVAQKPVEPTESPKLPEVAQKPVEPTESPKLPEVAQKPVEPTESPKLPEVAQ